MVLSLSCEEKIRSLSPEELEAFVSIDETIKKRTSYGLRPELITENNSTVLTWSNGSKKWYVPHSDSPLAKEAKKAGRTITLDANQVVVPYDYKTVEKFVGCLLPLPLYYCSFEAKERGEVDPLEATFCWALKQLQLSAEEKFREKYK